MYHITMILGDGIGPEISKATMDVIDASGVPIEWDVVNAGLTMYEKEGELIPNNVFESIEKNKIVLKGPLTTPIGEGFRSVNVFLRKKYDLFANIRPVQSLGAIDTPFPKIDLTIFRENTEDLYAGLEEMVSPDEAKSIKIITRQASTRIAKQAFEYAKKKNKRNVSVVTKANIMKYTDGLFLDAVRNVAKEYPNIELKEILIDNMCMQLVMDPSQFDIIVTENLYGDILSDLCAGLIGGLGMMPGANIGENIAIFEPVHGSAPDIAGKNMANPTALIRSAILMLEYLNENTAAATIQQALEKTLANPENFTKDLGGEISTTEFANIIIKNMKG